MPTGLAYLQTKFVAHKTPQLIGNILETAALAASTAAVAATTAALSIREKVGFLLRP